MQIVEETGTDTEQDLTTFEEMESEVQSYARAFPVIFDKAEGAVIYDQTGTRYIDFLAGAGSLNYGHNNPILRDALLEYIGRGGITHSLDLHTVAKEAFLSRLGENIFTPRGMDYVVQFTGPTGTNAVEAALKLARNVTGRQNIISFTNGFHGVSVGAMAATGNSHHRDAAGLLLTGATSMPFDNYLGDKLDTIAYLDAMLSDPSSGLDLPAAAIVETVQGEGGLNVASFDWLQQLEKVCRAHDMLLIIDDIQAGCGRTGTFFSFDNAGISPDIVTLSKSLSGYGLPFAVTLIKPEYDKWKPGEHNGTFRGNNHAFVTAEKAISHYWSDDSFCNEIARKGDYLAQRLQEIVDRHGKERLMAKGRGMMRGIECGSGDIAGAISNCAFENNMIIETSGSEDQVVKCLPPLTITDAELDEGLEILDKAVSQVMRELGRKAA